MKIKVIDHERKIAQSILHPIKRAKKELAQYNYYLADRGQDITFIFSDLFGNDENKHLLDEYYPAVILDTTAGTGTHKFKFMDRAAYYIKKQLLRDMNLYRFNYPRTRYHYYKIAELSSTKRLDNSISDIEFELDPDRIFVGWNLGVVNRLGLDTTSPFKWKNRPIDVHFSIKVRYANDDEIHSPGLIYDHYTYHRDLCTRVVAEMASRNKWILSGQCRKYEYIEKMKQSKVCISPLGLGEVCFRDFEAISNGAILVKPDMGHLITWPDVYRPWETYIPVKWDFSDMEEKIAPVIENPKKYAHIAEEAYNTLKRARTNEIFAARFNSIMEMML